MLVASGAASFCKVGAEAAGCECASNCWGVTVLAVDESGGLALAASDSLPFCQVVSVVTVAETGAE
jgi:hypothetical protein